MKINAAELRELNRNWADFIPKQFQRRYGAVPGYLKCVYNKEKDVVYYDGDVVEFESRFRVDEHGQLELEIIGEPKTDKKDKERVVLEGKPKYLQSEVRKSHFLRNRQMTENGTKIKIRIGVKRLPERLTDDNPLYAESFVYGLIEGFNIAKTRPIQITSQ